MAPFPQAVRHLAGAILLAAAAGCGSAAVEGPAPQAPAMVPVSLGRIRGYIATAAAFDYDARHWAPTLQDVSTSSLGSTAT